MPGLKHLIISEQPDAIAIADDNMIVMTPEDYIGNKAPVDLRKDSKLRIINLCKSYDYMSKGYYCSLLAEAREQRCIPPIESVITMNWKRLSSNARPELDALLLKLYRVPPEDEVAKTFIFFFGRAEDSRLEFLSRRIFDIFRFPLVSVEIKVAGDHWVISKIDPISLGNLPSGKTAFFNDALASYTGKAWTSQKKRVQEKFWLGILHDPAEKMPPSDKGALTCFLKAAKRHNVFAELITKNDMSSLLEYDALFIRETTSIDHHTYRFAYKAEMEGMPCLDDTASIIRCSNKVFLHEMMASKNLPTPYTQLIDAKTAKKMEKDLEFPVVLKIPDGSFSRGIVKAEDLHEFQKGTQTLFKRSDILLLQEFLPSDYDWRIGVLGGEPIFACQYYMAEGHWQIYNHKATGRKRMGIYKTLPLKKVPKEVLRVAVAGAALVGKGLYGVDLKQNDDGVYIIEINDNPNIDKGVEDLVAGDKLYDRIIDHFGMLVDKGGRKK